ncbi:MAG: hypothetical protein NT163_03015 [Chlorobiales bacterium]|nr:hypothetical protein [Chlorobiales bacterium]
MKTGFIQKIFGWTNPVKKRILDRYEQTPEGHIIIDVAARSVEDLYEDFDKTAPYHKKDLDEDLVYYLTECVREIGRSDFVIRFVFERYPSEEFIQRVRTSILKFFMYQRELELAAMKKMLRTSGMLLIIGVFILGASLWVTHLLLTEGSESFLNSVFAEGLTIVAWVSMWEGLATFLLNWAPHRFKINLYKKIAEAQVLFSKPLNTFSDAHAGSVGAP